MKTLSALFFLLLITVVFCGCSIDADERDFYYSGWLNPNAHARWKSGMQDPMPPPAGSIDEPILKKSRP